MHVGQLGDYRRDEFERVGDGRLFALALDAIEHGGVQGPEAQLRVVHARIAQHGAQARQFGFETGVCPAVVLADGELHQLQVQIVQVADQVERMFQMPFFVFALLMQQVGDVHVPEQEYVLLLVGDVLAGAMSVEKIASGLNCSARSRSSSCQR